MNQFKKNISIPLRRFYSWFLALSPRERGILVVASIGLLSYLVYLPIESALAGIADSKKIITMRTNDLENLNVVLARYELLKKKLDNLQTTFDDLPESFEPATKELDELIRTTTGSENYNLKKGDAPTDFGTNFEKQNYNLRLTGLSLEQITKLLYEIDRAKNAIFVGLVEIGASSEQGKFSLSLGLITVRKKPA